jgi:hypothetical protein
VRPGHRAALRRVAWQASEKAAAFAEGQRELRVTEVNAAHDADGSLLRSWVDGLVGAPAGRCGAGAGPARGGPGRPRRED